MYMFINIFNVNKNFSNKLFLEKYNGKPWGQSVLYYLYLYNDYKQLKLISCCAPPWEKSANEGSDIISTLVQYSPGIAIAS